MRSLGQYPSKKYTFVTKEFILVTKKYIFITFFVDSVLKPYIFSISVYWNDEFAKVHYVTFVKNVCC